MMYEIKENEEMCANCKYFIQHYRRIEAFDYETVCIGHCTYPRVKFRKPWETCKYFESRTFIEGDLLRNERIREERNERSGVV